MQNCKLSLLALVFISMFYVCAFSQGTWVVTSKDAFTYYNSGTGAGGDENHGGDVLIRVRSDDDVGPDIFIRDGYLQFDLDQSLFKEDVKQAFLKLTINRWYNQISGKDGQFSIYNYGETSWEELALNFNNSTWSMSNPGEAIASQKERIGQIASADPARHIVFDITKFVWDQLDQGNSSFTLILADTTAGKANSNGTDARFYSKEATPADEKSPDSTYFPYIVLDENPLFMGYKPISAKEDAYTNSSEPDVTHNEWQIRVRSAGTSNLRDAYLKFALGENGYNSSKGIEKVYLSLTSERIVGAGDDLFHLWPLADNSWSEETLTWNNTPWNKEMAQASEAIVSSDTLDNVSSSDPVKAIWFDVTKYVKAQLDSGNTEFSFVLSDTSYGTAWRNDGDLRIYSKESTTDAGAPSSWPKIAQESYIPTLYIKDSLATRISSKVSNIPLEFEILQNYPNPFNPTTTIAYQLSKSSRVDISIMDILGRKVATVESGVRSAGVHQVEWDGRNSAGLNVASGIYFTKISAENNSKIIKMVLMR